MWPRDDGAAAEPTFAGFVSAVARRLRLAALMRATAIGGAAGTAVTLVLHRAGLRESEAVAGAFSAAFVTAVLALWLSRHRWTPSAAAHEVERARPESRNVIVTADELRRRPERARPPVRHRVFADAARVTSALTVAEVVTVRRDLVLLALVLALWAGAIAGVPQRTADIVRQLATRTGDVARAHSNLQITATIVPPAYLAAPVQTLENPVRIDAVYGSRLRIAMRGGAQDWRIRYGAEALPTRREGEIALAEIRLVETGYLAVELRNAEASRRLIPVSVTPDRVPAVRISAPAKDLLYPDVRGSVAVEASATDDFGLRSLELRFTKVSGSGEQFEFEEGTLPLQIERQDERSWRGRGSILLSALALAPGDALVYRVVGRDARGDGGAGSSETFFVEIAGPGQVALTGFEMPPDRERYSLSQQMIVLKIERLRAREHAMQPDALREEVEGIAADQRAVRANFIFLTGGHVEDEEEEAAHSHEVQEGRLENTARREITLAIQHMTRAQEALVGVRTQAALAEARAAVDALQRAFGRNRYLLRAMSVRSRLDPARRLSGDLSAASDWSRPTADADVGEPARTAREILAVLLHTAAALRAGSRSIDRAVFSELAERSLAAGPAREEWIAISRGLLHLRDEAGAGTSGPELERALSELIRRAIAEVHRGALESAVTPEADVRLHSRWTEEQRRR